MSVNSSIWGAEIGDLKFETSLDYIESEVSTNK
jgi:hypothetical protein